MTDDRSHNEPAPGSGPTAYDVADHYDARYFDDLVVRYRRRNRFARTRIANVFALLPELRGRRVTDLGCGMGTFTIEAARHGALALGVDPAPAAVMAATAVARAEGVHAFFVRADAVQLPFPPGSIDVVIAADLVEHLDDGTLARVLAEARRVLTVEGKIVVYTPDRSHFLEWARAHGWLRQDPSHIAVRRASEIADRVRAAGFVVRKLRSQPSHLPLLNVLERVLGKWVPALRRRVGLVAGVV